MWEGFNIICQNCRSKKLLKKKVCVLLAVSLAVNVFSISAIVSHITSLGIPQFPTAYQVPSTLENAPTAYLVAVPHANLQNYCPHSNHILKLHLTTKELGLTVILITCLLSTFPLSGIIGAHKEVNRNTVH